MSDKKWRDDLDLLLEESIRELIRETKEYDYAIRKSKNPGKAQIWVALGLLNQKINLLYPEKERNQTRIPKEELDKILNTIEKL